MDAEHRWLAKTEPGAGGRLASVEKGLGRDHFSFSYSQAIVYSARLTRTIAAWRGPVLLVLAVTGASFTPSSLVPGSRQP